MFCNFFELIVDAIRLWLLRKDLSSWVESLTVLSCADRNRVDAWNVQLSYSGDCGSSDGSGPWKKKIVWQPFGWTTLHPGCVWKCPTLFNQCPTHLEPLEVPMCENGHHWQNMAILGHRCRKTARWAAERPPTRKLKLSRVTSGYGGLKIPLGRICLTPKNRGYMGVA